MYNVTKRISFCYGHRLMKHAGKCSHYHGHNGVAEITCSSPSLNEDSMVIDFERITEALKTWIDENLDHVMILCDQDPLIPLLKDKNEPYYAIAEDPTAETLAKIIFEKGIECQLPVTSVTVWETPTSSANYSVPLS